MMHDNDQQVAPVARRANSRSPRRQTGGNSDHSERTAHKTEQNVSQEQLWAPWRLPYIKSDKDHQPAGCFLCRYRDAASADDAENYLLLRRENSLVVLNRFPYNNGHLLVAPASHKALLGELDDEEMLGCMRLLQQMTQILERSLSPQGFNIGLNLGRVAGAGLPGHLHWHLVPRWNGDTNFMPILADLNVIPQSLDALYELLKKELGT